MPSPIFILSVKMETRNFRSKQALHISIFFSKRFISLAKNQDMKDKIDPLYYEVSKFIIFSYLGKILFKEEREDALTKE